MFALYREQPRETLCQKIGTMIVCTPIVISVPGTAGYVLDQEAKTGNYAIDKMHEYQAKHPNSTHDQQYNVYQNCYRSHANSSIMGRSLTNWGIMKPKASESIIPDYKSDFRNSFSDLDKK
jgi:hypothetical protein